MNFRLLSLICESLSGNSNIGGRTSRLQCNHNTIRHFFKMSQVGCGTQWLSGFSLGTRMLGGTTEAEEAANGRSETGIGRPLRRWVPNGPQL